MSKIDLELLKLLPETSDKARALLEALAKRERGMSTTYYHVARRLVKNKGLEFTRTDFKDIGDVLTQCKVGFFDPSGQSRVFKWSYNLVSVANIALGHRNVGELKPQARSRSKPLPKIQPQKHVLFVKDAHEIPVISATKPKVNMITINKNGCQIDLSFDDLTEDRCKKIGMILESLPGSM